MKETRIITWDMKAKLEPEPWTAFIFEPESEGQTPEDYYAEYCGLLDDQGLLKMGATEAEAVFKLFKRKDVNPGLPSENKKVFEKNAAFNLGNEFEKRRMGRIKK